MPQNPSTPTKQPQPDVIPVSDVAVIMLHILSSQNNLGTDFIDKYVADNTKDAKDFDAIKGRAEDVFRRMSDEEKNEIKDSRDVYYGKENPLLRAIEGRLALGTSQTYLESPQEAKSSTPSASLPERDTVSPSAGGLPSLKNAHQDARKTGVADETFYKTVLQIGEALSQKGTPDEKARFKEEVKLLEDGLSLKDKEVFQETKNKIVSLGMGGVPPNKLSRKPLLPCLRTRLPSQFQPKQ